MDLGKNNSPVSWRDCCIKEPLARNYFRLWLKQFRARGQHLRWP